MKFPKPIPVTELAQKIGAKLIGDNSLEAVGINEIHHANKGDIIFVDVKKYFEKSLSSDASIVILNEKAKCPPGKALLVCDNPFAAYNGLVKEYRPLVPQSAAIADTAEIDPTAVIEPNVIIGPHVKIGKHCHIQANVTIREYTEIGDYVVIQPGSVIGSDAFYFKRHADGKLEKFCSGGRVIIEDHVDIGPCCTICKGASADTVIGEGTKFDGQVHIGHEVVIGKNCMFAAQVGIAGNTKIGDNVILYGQVGIVQNLKIGDNVVVYGQAGVSKNLEPGKVFIGSPANEARTIYREMAALRHLPEFFSQYYK